MFPLRGIPVGGTEYCLSASALHSAVGHHNRHAECAACADTLEGSSILLSQPVLGVLLESVLELVDDYLYCTLCFRSAQVEAVVDELDQGFRP